MMMAGLSVPEAMAAPRSVFTITADRCPQVLSRLLGLIAQRDRLIEHVDAVDTQRVLRITLSVPDMEAGQAAIIAEKMRQMIAVRTVKLRTSNFRRPSPNGVPAY